MTKKYVIKNFICLLQIILMFVFQHIPLFSLQMFGINSILIIPTFVSMSVFMNEKEAMIFGILSGLFLDMEVSNIFGVHIFTLLLLGYVIGFLSEHVMKVNLINTIIISFVVTLIIVGIRFLFFYVFKGYEDIFYAFVNHYLPSVLSTVIITPIMYLFNRSISYYTYGRGGV